MGTIIGLVALIMGWSVYSDFRPLLFIIIGVALTLKIVDKVNK